MPDVCYRAVPGGSWYFRRQMSSIARDLEFLGYERVSAPTIYRALHRHELTADRQQVRPQPAVRLYPMPKITCSGQWQQIDFIGPQFLRGSQRKPYFLVLRDLYNQAVYVEAATGRAAKTVLTFLIRGWQGLGMPERLSMDNAAGFSGSLWHYRTFSQVVRLCLLLGVESVFSPEGEACRHGRIENFNGLFDRLFYQRVLLRSLSHIRQQLRQLTYMANHQHPHQRMGYRTSVEVRQGQSLRQPPNDFRLPKKLLLAAGRVSFIRRVRSSGRITFSMRDSLSVDVSKENMSGRRSSRRRRNLKSTTGAAFSKALTTRYLEPECSADLLVALSGIMQYPSVMGLLSGII